MNGPLAYLQGYSEGLQAQVRALIARDGLGDYLHKRYPQGHQVQSDKSLYAYTAELRQRHMKNAPQIDKVLYDSKLDVVHRTLGLHSAVSRVQGTRLQAKREIRIASVFREGAPEFLKTIVVHELAHLKVYEHDKAFYALCEYMLPEYHQLELDLRLFLTHRALTRQSAKER
jgi:predicted metal-dependent hydrolase